MAKLSYNCNLFPILNQNGAENSCSNLQARVLIQTYLSALEAKKFGRCLNIPSCDQVHFTSVSNPETIAVPGISVISGHGSAGIEGGTGTLGAGPPGGGAGPPGGGQGPPGGGPLEEVDHLNVNYLEE